MKYIFRYLIILALIWGCGGGGGEATPEPTPEPEPESPTFALSGKAMLSDDEPLSSATVSLYDFDSDTLLGSAVTSSDGSYAITINLDEVSLDLASDGSEAGDTENLLEGTNLLVTAVGDVNLETIFTAEGENMKVNIDAEETAISRGMRGSVGWDEFKSGLSGGNPICMQRCFRMISDESGKGANKAWYLIKEMTKDRIKARAVSEVDAFASGTAEDVDNILENDEEQMNWHWAKGYMSCMRQTCLAFGRVEGCADMEREALVTWFDENIPTEGMCRWRHIFGGGSECWENSRYEPVMMGDSDLLTLVRQQEYWGQTGGTEARPAGERIVRSDNNLLKAKAAADPHSREPAAVTQKLSEETIECIFNDAYEAGERDCLSSSAYRTGMLACSSRASVPVR